MHFLSGNHSAAVPQPMTLVFSNISNLALVGPEVGPDEPPVAHIWCNYTMQFQFTNAINVSLKGLSFNNVVFTIQCLHRVILLYLLCLLLYCFGVLSP